MKLLLLLNVYIYFIYSPLIAASWSVPKNLSQHGYNATAPQIAIDPFDHSVAVWTRFNGQHMIIQASIKLKEREWQKIPSNLSPNDQDGFNPQIAIDSLGNVTVVWESFINENSVIYATTKNIDGKWSRKPLQLSSNDYRATSPKLTLDSLGNAIVVWEAHDSVRSSIQASIKEMGKWSQPIQISSDKYQSKNPQIAVSGKNDVIVVWQASNQKGECIQSQRKERNGLWESKAESLCEPSVGNCDPQVGIDLKGNITVIWNHFNGINGTIQAITKMYGKKWQTSPDTISSPHLNAFYPQLAVYPFGDVIAVWEGSNSKQIKVIFSSQKKLNKSWQGPNILSDQEESYHFPKIKIDKQGHCMVAWNNSKGFTSMYVIEKPIRGEWQMPAIVSSPGRSAFLPDFAFNQAGKATFLWVVQDSLSFIQTMDLLRNNEYY